MAPSGDPQLSELNRTMARIFGALSWVAFWLFVIAALLAYRAYTN